MNKSGSRSALKRLQTIYWRKTDDCTSFLVRELEASTFMRGHGAFTILDDVSAVM
ncbi:MAG: hypothetical protein ACLVJF_15305 [Blautia obeum]